MLTNIVLLYRKPRSISVYSFLWESTSTLVIEIASKLVPLSPLKKIKVKVDLLLPNKVSPEAFMAIAAGSKYVHYTFEYVHYDLSINIENILSFKIYHPNPSTSPLVFVILKSR